MVVKDRPIPVKIYFNQAILGRIPPNHPKIPTIEDDIRAKETGHKVKKPWIIT